MNAYRRPPERPVRLDEAEMARAERQIRGHWIARAVHAASEAQLVPPRVVLALRVLRLVVIVGVLAWVALRAR